MGQDAPQLTRAQVEALLARLEPAKASIVLIGGQALNLWAERYQLIPELAAAAPFTSKDIDFGGEASAVEHCAQLVGGEYQIFSTKDRSICAGIVTTPDGVKIDLVRMPCGVSIDDVARDAVSLPAVRVMHPIHVLQSRAANVVQIPRPDEHSLKPRRATTCLAPTPPSRPELGRFAADCGAVRSSSRGRGARPVSADSPRCARDEAPA